MVDSTAPHHEPEVAARVRRTRVAVVGGGIAGLVAAREWARIGANVTVFEREPRLGGTIETCELDGLPVDVGADSLPARSRRISDLLADLGLGGDLEPAAPQPVWVWGIPGSHVAAPLPGDTVLGIPANPWADDVRRVIGWRGAWRAYVDRLRPPLTIGHERSLGRLVRSRLGARVADRLVAPQSRGLYGVMPDEVDVDVAAPGLSAALTRVGSLSGAVGAQLPESPRGGASRATIRGGLGRLVDALVAHLDELDVTFATGTAVRSLTRRDAAWSLAVAPTEPAAPAGDDAPDGSEPSAPFVADVVVAATAGAVDLLRSAGLDLSDALPADLHRRTVVTLVVTSDLLDAAPRGRAVYPLPPGAGRPTDAAGLVHATADWRWLAAVAGPGRHVLRVMLEGQRADEADAVATAVAAASDLLGVPLGGVRAAAVRTLNVAAPASTLGHEERVARAREAVAGLPGVAVVGAWMAGSGLAQVVGDTTDEIDRQRRALIWQGVEASPDAHPTDER